MRIPGYDEKLSHVLEFVFKGKGARTSVSTARDVARLAGVSQSTVSRVLNNYAHVRPEVRERVAAAVKALAYEPNELARSLVTNRSRSLGLIVGDINNPFFAETTKGIVETARHRGYAVIISTTNNQHGVHGEAIRLLRSQQVEGLILGSVEMGEPDVTALVESGFPTVFYNRVLHANAGHYVTLNNLRGARLMTEHLLGLGHRRIAVMPGSRSFSTFSERLQGYGEVLREHGIPVDARLVLPYAGYASDRQGSLRRLLNQSEPPSAIFAMTDNFALEVMDTLADLGLRVPEDVAVTGFDDISLAGHSRIGLTTVAQQKHLMGRLVVEALVEILEARTREQPPQPTRILLEPQLLVRRTCGAELHTHSTN